MISFEEAFSIVMESAVGLGAESVPLMNACGRVLTEDVQSDIDIPPFDKSAMDGYACKSADLDRPLEIVETIAAGRSPMREIGGGQCAKIMTGGVVPAGADCVVMVEHTEILDGKVIVTKKTGALNICYRAEDVAAGDIVLRRGTLLAPSEIAVLASVGCASVPVSRQLVVGIASTGDELVDPASKPSGAEIRDSNGAQLHSQAVMAGCAPVDLGIVEDSPAAIGSLIEREIDRVDLFLLSGGVSMGEFDYVPQVLRDKGFEIFFEKVAVKPGKPTVFGRKENTFVFGLPGNPVSTFLIFELFVKPFCYKLMGCAGESLVLTAKLSKTIKRRKSNRLAFIPIRFEADGAVRAIEYHGSAHIHAYTSADGFASIPAGADEIQSGELVRVRLTRPACTMREET